jgi:hypothetical protein
VYRVLKRDTHFYLMCDPETAFIAKPIAEQAGFKFWKPLVWDKCLGPETPVRSDRGVIPAKDITPGDHVYTPDGRLVTVLATRDTRAPAVRVALSTGATLVASTDHRFLLADGTHAEAGSLRAGATLAQGSPGLTDNVDELRFEDLLEDDERVLEFPDPCCCLFCGQAFESTRAAAAHQARFCDKARSKAAMAEELGVAPKRLRRWLNEGRLPVAWAKQLGLAELATAVRSYACKMIRLPGFSRRLPSIMAGESSSASSRPRVSALARTSASPCIARRSTFTITSAAWRARWG